MSRRSATRFFCRSCQSTSLPPACHRAKRPEGMPRGGNGEGIIVKVGGLVNPQATGLGADGYVRPRFLQRSGEFGVERFPDLVVAFFKPGRKIPRSGEYQSK